MPAETLTLGGGCFWCLEAVFLQVKGVTSVVSGYAGGSSDQADYRSVCSGMTGHAEVIQINFDPDAISTEVLLEIFFSIHDPTTLNRQGADQGSQYRSVIFYNSEDQKSIAEQIIKSVNESGEWSDPVVTEVNALDRFYPAEQYHQNYFNQNLGQPYCQAVIAPKLAKFMRKYSRYQK